MIAPLLSNPAPAGEAACRDVDETAWTDRPMVWLRRFTGARFAALVPLVGLLLHAAEEDRIASPGATFAVVLFAAVVHLLLFVAARRASDAGAVQAWLLTLSLALDLAFVLALVRSLGLAAAPLAAFVTLPVFGAALALPERRAALLALLAVAGVIAAGSGLGGVAAAGIAALVLAQAAAVLWYRRRGAAIEDRLRRLERERTLAPAYSRPSATDPAGVGALAEAIADELAEPAPAAAGDRVATARLTLLAALGSERADAAASADPRPLARSVEAALGRAWERSGVRVKIEVEDDVPAVACPADELELVLFRLVDAACRATAAQGRRGRVSARFRRDAHSVQLRVDDPCPGPAGDADPFQPSFNPKERPRLGLALAVARGVAERRAGDVVAVHRSKGGFAVRVTLPAVPGSAGSRMASAADC